MDSTIAAVAVTDFLRYHVLVRVFGGDVQEWLQLLQSTDRHDSADARFLRWLWGRVDADPTLLDEIRHVVNTSGLWPTEEHGTALNWGE
jgi:hypothetical protein